MYYFYVCLVGYLGIGCVVNSFRYCVDKMVWFFGQNEDEFVVVFFGQIGGIGIVYIVEFYYGCFDLFGVFWLNVCVIVQNLIYC